MSTWITNNFDIDLWIKLASQHPLKFEQQRQQWLEQSIQHARPEDRPRLEGIHWEINMDLQLAKNKYRKCNLLAARIVKHLETFKDILSGNLPIYFNPMSAKILNFIQPQE